MYTFFCHYDMIYTLCSSTWNSIKNLGGIVHLIWVFFIWQLSVATICHLVYSVNVAHCMDPTWTHTLVYIQLKSYVYDRSPLWLVH